ncbi:MAG TPA: hypothetical protein DCZ59_07560 [Bacteroidetes bacterium]|nr:hypothetical protein [Bacteroidota bacterium]
MNVPFLSVLQVFQVEGLVSLGKMLHPATNETAKNEDYARYVIGVLETLKQKTEGNLEVEEQRFLDQTLSLLKLNFVEVFGNPDAPSTRDSLA